MTLVNSDNDCPLRVSPNFLPEHNMAGMCTSNLGKESPEIVKPSTVMLWYSMCLFNEFHWFLVFLSLSFTVSYKSPQPWLTHTERWSFLGDPSSMTVYPKNHPHNSISGGTNFPEDTAAQKFPLTLPRPASKFKRCNAP